MLTDHTPVICLPVSLFSCLLPLPVSGYLSSCLLFCQPFRFIDFSGLYLFRYRCVSGLSTFRSLTLPVSLSFRFINFPVFGSPVSLCFRLICFSGLWLFRLCCSSGLSVLPVGQFAYTLSSELDTRWGTGTGIENPVSVTAPEVSVSVKRISRVFWFRYPQEGNHLLPHALKSPGLLCSVCRQHSHLLQVLRMHHARFGYAGQ